ncbi:hypothetical protein IWW50_005926, partial [Coemansia erecta]
MADNSLYADAGDSYSYAGAGDADTQWLYNDNHALAVNQAPSANQQEPPTQDYSNNYNTNDYSRAAAPHRPSGGSNEEG